MSMKKPLTPPGIEAATFLFVALHLEHCATAVPGVLLIQGGKLTCLLCKQYRIVNTLTPNDPYSGRTAPLISKRCISYIYSSNIGTEHFKHGINSPFFNTVCFIILTYLVPVLFTFHTQGVLKFKKIIPTPKG